MALSIKKGEGCAIRISKETLEQRKYKIIHTAYKLFCEHGIDGINLVDIAKASNVGASAIYRYFENKAKLLWLTQRILWIEITEQIHADGEEHLLMAKTGFEELSILLYRFKLLYTKYSSYLLFANEYKMYLIRNKIKLPKKEYDQIMEPVNKMFTSALRRGQIDGSIIDKDSVEDQFYAIWGIMRSFTDQIVVYERMYDAKNPWESRFDMVYNYTLNALKGDE